MTHAAPIIVTAEIGPADLRWLDDLRKAHYPADRNQLPAHLTLFHHLTPSLLPELDSRLRAGMRAAARPPARIGEPILLGRGVALRVRSAALEAIRCDLREVFSGLLTPQDAADWRPHVTIQNKVEPVVARSLHLTLCRMFDTPRPLEIVGLCTFHYRGGPWEPIRRYRFAR